ISERLPRQLVAELEDLAAGSPEAAARVAAGQPLGRRVDVVDAARGVGADDPVADRGQGDLGALLLPVQGLRRLLELGDVQGDGEAADDPSVVVAERLV